MQNPEQASAMDQPPKDEEPVRRCQFSLSTLMIAMSLACALLVLLPVGRFLIDRRTIALLAVIVVVGAGGSKVIRSAAVGGMVGVCLGLYGWDQRWWNRNWQEPADDGFTIVTIGVCLAWFVVAIQLTKRAEKVGIIALLTFVIWLPCWLLGQMR